MNDGAGGSVANRTDAGAVRAISVSRPHIGIGGTLAVVAAVLVLLAVALWVPAATMSFAVVAIGVGGIAWRKGRTRPRKTGDLEHAELVRLWRPIPLPRWWRRGRWAGCWRRKPRRARRRSTPSNGPICWSGAPTRPPCRCGCWRVPPVRASPGWPSNSPVRSTEGWEAGIARPGTAAQVVPAAAGAGIRCCGRRRRGHRARRRHRHALPAGRSRSGAGAGAVAGAGRRDVRRRARRTPARRGVRIDDVARRWDGRRSPPVVRRRRARLRLFARRATRGRSRNAARSVRTGSRRPSPGLGPRSPSSPTTRRSRRRCGPPTSIG